MPYIPPVQFSPSSDSVPTSKPSNDAMPRLNGYADPDALVHMSVDGQEVSVAATEWGNWTVTSPELDETQLKELIYGHFRRLPANGHLYVKEPRPSDDWLISVDHGSASWDGGGRRQPKYDFKTTSNGM